MKILRRHRGFTTNSSSASEWIDPSDPPASIPLDQFDASGSRIPTPQPTTATRDEGPATISLEGYTAPKPSATSTPAPKATPAPRNIAAENTLMVFGFLGTVLGVFVLERIIRRKLRQRKEED
jgi:hypothetical protein